MEEYTKFETVNSNQFADIGSKPDGGFSIFEFLVKSLIYKIFDKSGTGKGIDMKPWSLTPWWNLDDRLISTE